VSVLVDSSVWVDYLKLGECGPGAAVATLLRRREVITCGPIVAELLAGTPPAARAELSMLMNGLPWADLHRDAWRRIGEVVGDLLRLGFRDPLTEAAIAGLLGQQSDPRIDRVPVSVERQDFLGAQLDGRGQDECVGQLDLPLGSDLGGTRRDPVRDRLDAPEAAKTPLDTASFGRARSVREHEGFREGDRRQRQYVLPPGGLQLLPRTFVVDVPTIDGRDQHACIDNR
jgi:predicted nucleic acid-binding protein